MSETIKKMRKTPTLKDVAGRLGMHKSTVSLALSGKGTISAETRRQVLTAAHELGYEPNPIAQRLASGNGASMVCIFSGVLDVGLATEKILLIQKALAARSLEVPIYTCYDPVSVGNRSDLGDGRSQAAQVRQLCRQRPRAIICAAQRVHRSVLTELENYQNDGGIVVAYDTPIPLACDAVIFDREDNAYRAARHVLDQGHRRLGIAMSQGGGAFSDLQSYRLNGFRRALEEYGVPFRDEWFFRTGTYEHGGAEMAERFLRLKERPTALTIVNDYVALAFMVEVMRAGVRVPEDLSVVGHDNQPIAAYCPVPLTSMTQPTQQIAQTVVELLMQRLDAEADHSFDGIGYASRRQVITGELVLRSSTSAAA